MRSITSFMALAITSFCVLKRNDVDLKVKWCLRFHRKTMLCPQGHKHKNKKQVFRLAFLLGGDTQIWTGESGFCRPMPYHLAMSPDWSGWRGSNSLPPPWQGGALPDELHPHKWCPEPESNQRHVDFQSTALPTELSGQIWRPGTGSNRRPLAWQASVLTSWTTGPNPNVVETTGLEPVTPCL